MPPSGPDLLRLPVRAAFNYFVALLMVEAGKAKLIETRPGEPVPADKLGAGTISVY